jgi:sterol desaturase/sphingolipid hydroxylase (fatty acid hydroxylase superfamily)
MRRYLHAIRLRIRRDLESPASARKFGSGWMSGVAGLVLATASLALVLCLRYPQYLTIAEIRPVYETTWFRLVLHLMLIAAFASGVLNMALRPTRVLGFTAVAITLLATILGGSRVETEGTIGSGSLLGIDWFVLNVLFTGFLFIPLEKISPRWKDQPLFRQEWREDLFYFLVSSLFVQCLTFITLQPSMAILAKTEWSSLRAYAGAQPTLLQIFEIMLITDFVQYWVHRAFHCVPFLWRFHAVHHSARSMDWMAGARMHVLEILFLRAFTVTPMMVLGFSESAIHLYILLVYLYSTFIHANIDWEIPLASRLLVSPRFHHWHHGIEREAIDVNFAIHFPLYDKMFGTYHMPEDRWPSGYGIKGHPVPLGYLRQFLYPFKRQ